MKYGVYAVVPKMSMFSKVYKTKTLGEEINALCLPPYTVSEFQHFSNLYFMSNIFDLIFDVYTFWRVMKKMLYTCENVDNYGWPNIWTETCEMFFYLNEQFWHLSCSVKLYHILCAFRLDPYPFSAYISGYVLSQTTLTHFVTYCLWPAMHELYIIKLASILVTWNQFPSTVLKATVTLSETTFSGITA